MSCRRAFEGGRGDARGVHVNLIHAAGQGHTARVHGGARGVAYSGVRCQVFRCRVDRFGLRLGFGGDQAAETFAWVLFVVRVIRHISILLNRFRQFKLH